MIFMTLKFFPWHLFKFMSFLQFPERLLTPVCAFLSLGLGYSLNKVRIRIKNFNLICVIFILMVSFLEIGGILFEYGQLTAEFSNDDLSNIDKFHSDNYWYNVLEISSPDYIYKDSQIDFKNYGYIIKTDNEENDKSVFDRSRYNELVFTVGYTKENAYYILPVSYYKGYVVDVYEEENYLMSLNTVADKETGLVRIELPEYNSGKLLKFVCSYKKTNLQIIGEIISKISLGCFLVVLFLKSKVYKWIIGTVYKKHHT